MRNRQKLPFGYGDGSGSVRTSWTVGRIKLTYSGDIGGRLTAPYNRVLSYRRLQQIDSAITGIVERIVRRHCREGGINHKTHPDREQCSQRVYTPESFTFFQIHFLIPTRYLIIPYSQ
jgi:hypothetical protein